MRFLPLIAACSVGAATIKEQQQVPIQEHIESKIHRPKEEDFNRPSIGIHFTSSHAIPAARYPNGTTLDLTTVEGDAEYMGLMSRWMRKASNPSRRQRSLRKDWCETHPHYEECEAYTAQIQRQDDSAYLASNDTAILSKLLMQVRISVETELDIKMTTFAPAMFQLGRNESNIVHHAIELIGLPSRGMNYENSDIILDTTAAYAGTRAVPCKDCLDSKKYEGQGSEPSQLTVLFVDFDNHSFSASVRSMRREDTSHSIGSQVHLPELGWWNLPIFEIPRAKFWARVHETILDVVGTLSEPIGRIVLMGEHGADKEFEDVVKTAMWSAMEIDVGSMLQRNKPADVGRIAARGAAEMAWRGDFRRRKAEVSERY
ncbi:hypothetical protein NX059_006720 [Plenodomus lindquistii]|nr:hypothetical protein NX059_006720 [Plenodomus lindquistii]